MEANNMDRVNGSRNDANMNAVGVEDSGVRKLSPAYVITRGQVVTRIWADPNHWGGITWKVDQVRVKPPTASRQWSKSFYFDNLQDAMRGLYAAQRWIWLTEHRRSVKRFLPWNWI
jgi:hypothetical protein